MSPEALHTLFGPHVHSEEPEFHLWTIHAPDGGEAQVYADTSTSDFSGFVISRFSTGLVLDLLVQCARRSDAVILAPGCPTMITSSEQHAQLPEELRDDARLVQVAADVEVILKAC